MKDHIVDLLMLRLCEDRRHLGDGLPSSETLSLTLLLCRQKAKCSMLEAEHRIEPDPSCRSLNESSSLHTSLNTKSSNNRTQTNKAYQRQLWHALIPSSNSMTRALLYSFNSKRSKLIVSFNPANRLKIILRTLH
jgi:hypothetical protein